MRKNFISWWWNEQAVIALEVGLLMPVMLVILMGVIDTGNGVVASQKMINAAQTVGDLIGRDDSVTTAQLNDCIEAGKLSMMPLDTTTFGVDVAGIQFVGGPTKPKVIWDYTYNSDPNPTILTKASGLGADQEGVLGVTAKYTYTPYFAGVLSGSLPITEISYVRGRNGLFIPKV